MSPGARLDAMRRARPLLHNITNFVAMNFMANALLAAGAIPAMVHAREEVGEFAARADALTINIGTLSGDWIDPMVGAIEAARQAGRPWVLDPVAAGATRHRLATARRLAALGPAAIRGNASEIVALAGGGGAGRGPDAGVPVGEAEAAARTLALETGAVVAVTGAKDHVTDGRRVLAVGGGHPLMGRVTALGCGLTGVVAAFLATSDGALEATAAALAYYGRAGELAGAGAAGPGSFAVGFLDALAALDGARLDAAAGIAEA